MPAPRRMGLRMSLLDLCSYLGLAAVGFISLNLVLGMLISLRYSPVRLWPHRRFNLFALHRWTAYCAMLLLVAHPTVLLFLHTPRFRIVDLLWPVHSYLQPKLNLAGAAASYLLMIVLLSSLMRTYITRRLWRNLHFLVYPAAVLLFLHSILTDPDLRDGHPDLLDGGKLFAEAAALLITGAVILRVRLNTSGLRSSSISAHKRHASSDESGS